MADKQKKENQIPEKRMTGRYAKMLVKRRAMKDPREVMSFRIKLLFFGIFLLFLVLIGRLYQMQILTKNSYAEQMKATSLSSQVVTQAPRGQIFDATGAPIAQTSLTPSVTFTRTAQITAPQMLATAQKLVPIVGQYVDTSTLTLRDKKDYYLANAANLDKINAELPTSEKQDNNGNPLSSTVIYDNEVAKVPDSAVNYTGNDLIAAGIFTLMNATQFYATSNIVTGGISSTQEAQIGAMESQLPGISLGSAWSYNVDPNNLLAPIIGTVGPIPAGTVNQYTSKGYQLSDIVGTSYLQQEFESYLQGQHQVVDVTSNSNGGVTQKVLQTKKAGDNLKLTVNTGFENGVQQILTNEFNKMMDQGWGTYSQGVYAVTINPQTGAILSMNGIYRDPNTGNTTPDALGTMTKAFEPGSTVKLGTITAGWENNVITGNQVLDDQPIQIAGSEAIKSWFTNGSLPIDAVQALELSSNTYAIQVALKINGTPYFPNMTLPTDVSKTLDTLRNTYAEYGLGTSTGVDIPLQSPGGYITSAANAPASSILFEPFGQFDTYTPLQMAQYAATMAMSGKRIAPHIVEGIYNGNGGSGLGTAISQTQPKILNQVNISSSDMSLLQQGMYQVANGSGVDGYPNTGSFMKNAAVTIYAKDGEAQTLDNGFETDTNNVVAFAPDPQNPQLAIAVMCPGVLFRPDVGNDGGVYPVNQYITTDIVNLYNQMFGFKK